jgi:hypothetical protein
MRQMRKRVPVIVTILVAIGCGGGSPQQASAKTEAPAQQGASATPQAAGAAAQPAPGARGHAAIQVMAKLVGAAPKPQAVQMNADPVCQQQHASPVSTEEVVADAQGGLTNVFVYVKEGVPGTFAPPAAAVTLNQAGCWYQPHVFGIQTGQPLEIVNSDATLHNVNAKPVANTPFNIAQPVKGMKTKKAFAKPEVMVKFKCNVHPWMSAYAGVVAHPFFAVTDAQGAATIAGLPAGSYVVEAWHERYGTQTQTVDVGEDDTASVEWTFQ